MVEPKQIIEEIRKIRFGIGLDLTNLTEEQRAALKDKEKILKDASKLAKEIHTKNPHFIFELIQNADDNKYENSKPTIRFIIDSDRLIIQNNEKGFEEENVKKLCEIGGTTKENKTLGYIGEKGIGFKSVFMVADKVEIYSNGFQFRFWHSKENPLWEKWENTTMIIPEWIDEIPDFVDPNQTNIVLYLKPEIRNEISRYFEELHPSLLLFLRKLKVIEVEERDKNKIRKMELQEKNGIVEIVYDDRKSCWKVVKKLFNVPQNINEERRKGVNKTEIILAFPLKEDYSPDTSNEQFVFAFLPVRNYGFKFIIQADFLLPITREDIIKDNKWNEWLRDSIAEVFLEAIGEFKKDEKLKYRFYDYLPLEEVKDEFFLPLVEQIYEKLKEEECILTEANRWKKPSEVLIGDEKIKKIVTNEDLQKFFGKEYLSGKIKAKKSILSKLGVRDFSVDDLIKCLENVEWIEKQNEEWFASLFSYLSKKKLSNEQLERLKSLKIIKLENGKLTSINEGVVFFPLEKKEAYGFESELRVIKKDIVDTISKYEKEERDSILEFLKKLGLKQADPYEVIENHILPIYENGEWKQKDSKVLIGYIRYIKDNIDKYERESDRRLNVNKSSEEPKEDPLKRLKKSLLIRINKNIEGENWYAHPENIYLPKIYGNENNLEKLFEGIEVSFIHPCYIESDLKKIDKEINELENKLKGKSKKWRKKHRKDVKKIEGQLNKLKEEKKRKVEEWKVFFLKIGVNEIPKIEIKIETRKRKTSSRKVRSRSPLDLEVESYSSPDIISILQKREPERNKKLLIIMDKYWDYYSKFTEWTDWDFYYTWNPKVKKSDWFEYLVNKAWLPTTQNTLAKPSEVFLDRPEIREVLGDTVPYLAVKIENEDFIKTLGINTRANVSGVLNYLKTLVEQKSQDKEKFEKFYKFLDEHFEEDSTKIVKEFARSPLIFVPGTEKEYYSSKEVIWRDVSNIFGKNRIYLEKYYPELRKFFVEKLTIIEKPTPKDYADVLCSISEKSEISNEDKKIIVRIYEELNRNLNPDKVENPISQEDWWNNFIKKQIFLTDKGEFWYNVGNIFINDNNELYELFKDEKDIGFLWLPEGYHPDKIKFFIKACGLRYLSESVETKPLLEETTYSKDKKLTQLIQTVVPYVLRYLYWKENSEYEELKKSGILEKIGAIEVYVTDNLKAKYSINVNEWKRIDKVAKKNCIYDNNNNKLYISKNSTNIDHLALEFSKLFGKIKGLDTFLLLIMNVDNSKIEQIMEIQNIGELPDTEMNILKKSLEIKKVEQKDKTEEELDKTPFKKGDEGVKEKSPPISTGTTPRPLTELTGERAVTETKGDVFDGIKEKEWAPEIPAEKVPIRIEEYMPKQETIKEIDEDETSAGRVHITRTSKGGTQPTEILSEKARKDIGREGEKYALYSIIKDKLVEYFNIEIGEYNTFEDILEHYANIVKETNKGFNLEKDGDLIVEVIWLNKNGESGEHYDIKVVENGEEIFIEVKSTKEYDKAWFSVSKDQWRLMEEKGDNFYIYRVYGAGRKDAKILKIRNPAKLWKEGKIDIYPIGIEL